MEACFKKKNNKIFLRIPPFREQVLRIATLSLLLAFFLIFGLTSHYLINRDKNILDKESIHFFNIAYYLCVFLSLSLILYIIFSVFKITKISLDISKKELIIYKKFIFPYNKYLVPFNEGKLKLIFRSNYLGKIRGFIDLLLFVTGRTPSIGINVIFLQLTVIDSSFIIDSLNTFEDFASLQGTYNLISSEKVKNFLEKADNLAKVLSCKIENRERLIMPSQLRNHYEE